MLPSILSDRQHRYLAKQLEDERQAAFEAKRQAYAQKKEHERSMVQQALDIERQMKESNLCSAIKYLDTMNSGSAKHKLAKFHLIFVERGVSHTV
jgi:sRNA-binding protein